MHKGSLVMWEVQFRSNSFQVKEVGVYPRTFFPSGKFRGEFLNMMKKHTETFFQ